MVYVDTAPGTAAIDPDFADDEFPLWPVDLLAEQENLDGLTQEQLDTFRDRSVPQPGSALRYAPVLYNDARLDVPSTVICTGFSSDEYKAAAKEGCPWLDGLNELRDLTYIDLPTSHWPMWSRPRDLAEIIGKLARQSSG